MIESIFIATVSGEQPTRVDEVEVVAQKGIVGDRNFGKDKWPGQNVTFIEAEEIEHFNKVYSLDASAHSFRRNIVTRGVRLNQLVGSSFTIGGIQFYGVELCEPCAGLGNYLATESLPATGVVNALVHKAGLRANVLSSGFLKVGMALSRETGG